jgi:hypothetical protein
VKSFRKHCLTIALAAAAVTGAGCSGPGAKTEKAPPAASAPKPAVPPEVVAAAQASLGSDAEVLTFGDLAKNGRLEALAVNRLDKAPHGALPGLIVTRTAILEREGNEWMQILLADEYLKNPKGFLAGTPFVPVPAWRLQYEQHPDGLVLYFTPAERPAGGTSRTIAVRYNPVTHRYESLDQEFKHFLGESPSLNPPTYRIRE